MSTAIALAWAVLAASSPSRAFHPAPLGNEPVRPYTDLGPVAVPTSVSETKLRKHLQLIADRIGADGFIIESRDPFTVYTQCPTCESGVIPHAGLSGNANGSASGSGLEVVFAAIAFANHLLHKPGPNEQVFIRAYTYADLPAASRDKLLQISAELFHGKLTLAAFEDARREILEAN